MDIAIMNDVNCPWSVAQALEMERAFRPYQSATGWRSRCGRRRIMTGLARVRRGGATHIAAGENAAGLHDFVDMFQKGSIDIAQPSVSKIGGITEMRKIVAAAEGAFGRARSPTAPTSDPAIWLRSTLLLARNRHAAGEASTPTWRQARIGEPCWRQDGKVRVPTGPGLGVDPDLAIVEKYRQGPAGIIR